MRTDSSTATDSRSSGVRFSTSWHRIRTLTSRSVSHGGFGSIRL